MIKQQTVICLYQNNCKDGESLGRQKQACRQAVNKLFWNIRAELICDQDADVPLMCRNAMQEALPKMPHWNVCKGVNTCAKTFMSKLP